MKKNIKNMNSKMITNAKLSTTEPKKQKQKQTKRTTRIGTESQKWRSHGGLSEEKEKERGKRGGKASRNKKHNW